MHLKSNSIRVELLRYLNKTSHVFYNAEPESRHVNALSCLDFMIF